MECNDVASEHGRETGVLEFISNWVWLYGFALGVLLLLVGYRVLRVGDEELHKKNGRLIRVGGFICILVSIFLVVLQLFEPGSHGQLR
jgi:hypothetical protein